MPRISILHLEDDPMDAELISSVLERDGLDFESDVVDTRKAFVAAFESAAYDLILADFTLPSFDGLSALEIVRRCDSRIPFILVSGNLGEEVAVDALKAGATDYVLKSKLSRLAPVVRRALVEAAAVAERRSAEEALRQSQEQYRDLVEKAGVAIVVDDEVGRLRYFNQTFIELFGYTEDEIEHMAIWDFIYEDDIETIREIHRRRLAEDPDVPESYRSRCVRKDGRVIHLEVVSTPLFKGDVVVGSRSYLRDVTDRIRLEEELAQMQKLEALGQLAGGIAHDFNNLMMSILGSTELLGLGLTADGPESQELTTIREAVSRGAELTQRLLAVASQQFLEMEVTDIRPVINCELKILRRLIPENIRIDYRSADDLPLVLTDHGQISQILMNLIVNARDAMPAGGTITISTESTYLTGEETLLRTGIATGPYLCLLVKDTGEGMDAATLTRIFDPFFTTKAEGEGTGMGLATVYGIVQQHNGFIEVQSEPGGGTCFAIHLPTTDGEIIHKDDTEETGSFGGSETILVVEDEVSVRAVMVRMLKAMGYAAVEAEDGNEALKLLREGLAADLILSDVVMPNMGGYELLERARQTHPTVPFLFSSGYTNQALRERLIAHKRTTFIAKPFTKSDLSRSVRQAFNRKGK